MGGCSTPDAWGHGWRQRVFRVSQGELLGAAAVRELATELGVRPQKRWGQNFVIDANTVRRIVRVADLTADDIVIEIGPGLGSLTLALLPMCQHVVAVEVDPVLAAALPNIVASRLPECADSLTVLCENALNVTRAQLSGTVGPPTCFVANLPYNVAVPVVLHLLEHVPTLQRGLVMVQLEVAERLVASPGSRTYGVPSAKAAWYGSVTPAGRIGRNVFWPAPRVDSGLVSFQRREPPPTTAARTDVFSVIDAAFAQRRKSLRSALANWAGSADVAEAIVRAAGIDPAIRGERLSVAQFAAIAQNVPSAGP